MGYFNFHARNFKKIKNGELIDLKIVEKWNNISPALLLFFCDGLIVPIREHRWQEYFKLFADIDKGSK